MPMVLFVLVLVLEGMHWDAFDIRARYSGLSFLEKLIDLNRPRHFEYEYEHEHEHSVV